jgi:hypothetical protein
MDNSHVTTNIAGTTDMQGQDNVGPTVMQGKQSCRDNSHRATTIVK